MRLPVFLAAAFLLSTAVPPAAAETPRPTASQHRPLDAFAAAQRSKKRASGHRAYRRSGTQIACTPAGCHPIPPGCRVRPGMNPFTWNPTGFDEIICPYYR